MTTVIKIIGLYNGEPHRLDGLFVQAYDPSSSPEGDPMQCILTGTADPRKAEHFDDFLAASAFALQVDQRNPVRPEGQPNRPLTAFTIQFMSLEQAEAES